MLNLGHHSSFYWDGRKPTLEEVVAAAWSGQLSADPNAVAAALNAVPAYAAHFQRAFGAEASATSIAQALAAFLRVNSSGNSAWDKFEQGDTSAVSKDAQKGFEVFKKANCALCHVPPLYSDLDFHNVGVGFKKKKFVDAGRMDATKDAADQGKFKTPSLRDVALTAPYFHDGSVKTLDKAIDLMLAGGVKNPKLDPKLKKVKLKPAEKKQLKAFLLSLTGEHPFDEPPTLP
jgi:cytochrome c peroxidase